jgi:cation diffusion facilitator family transporter
MINSCSSGSNPLLRSACVVRGRWLVDVRCGGVDGDVAIDVVGVEQRLRQQVQDVIVGRGVVHEGAFTAARDQTGQPQFRQVLADRGRCGAGEFRQAGDRGFPLQQRPEHLDAGGVGQHPERLDREVDLFVTGHVELRLRGVHDHAGHHGHGHRRSLWDQIKHAVTPHSHDSADIVDSTLQASARGMRALWISFAGLMITAVAQAVVVTISGSVALLGDTLHNFADALTAIPLAIAFLLGRRAATRRFTYGLGRSEDLAGLVILLVMFASAVLAAWTAIDRLLQPRDMTGIGWVAGAGLVGFVGNEVVARYRITVGRQIGSAALVADGLHARTDGFTSLAVLLAAGGSWLGWRWADPVVGLLIAVAILSVLYGAAKEVFSRMLDAVDPALVDTAEQTLAATPRVRGVDTIRLRWVGHTLIAESELDVDPTLTLLQAHTIAHHAEHRLIDALPRLAQALIHAHPGGDGPPNTTSPYDSVRKSKRT